MSSYKTALSLAMGLTVVLGLARSGQSASACTDGRGASAQKSVYLLFDKSGSMRGELGRCAEKGSDRVLQRLQVAKTAAIEVVNGLGDDVCLGLAVFGPVQELVPLGRGNKAQVIAAIESLQPGGKTPLGDVIDLGSTISLKQRDLQLGYGDHRVLITTDGAPDDRHPDSAKYMVERAVAARKAGTNIFAVGFCLPEGDHPLNNPEITVSYMEANSPEKLVAALRSMVPESDAAFDAALFKKK